MTAAKTLKTKIFSGAVLALAAGSLASASTVGLPGGPYNVISFTTMSDSSDVGGSIAVGTELSGTFAVGHELTSGAQWAAVIGKDIKTGSTLMDNSAANVFAPSGNVILNNAAATRSTANSPIDFNVLQSTLKTYSTTLSQQTATGAISNGKIVATSTGLNVFNLTAADYGNLTSITTGGGTVLINVGGTPGVNQNMFVDGQQNTAGSTVASKVLFNFYADNGTLTLGNALGGSVLAPLATVTGASQFTGEIVANSLIYTGEIHSSGIFKGTLNAAATPEPGAMGLAGLGLTAAAFLMRKRRS